MGWARSPRSPASASTAPRGCEARGRLDGVTRPSAAARHHPVCPSLASPATASTCDALHAPLAPGRRRLTVATRPGRTAARYAAGAAQARATPACPQGARPAVLVTQANSTWSGPLGGYPWAGTASGACACFARRAEPISGLSFWRRCFPGASGVGCTPSVRAHALTVFRPWSASNATRALQAALYGCRCVDLARLLTSSALSHGHSILS